MTWSLGTTIVDYYRVQSWVETPAQILTTKLEQNRGSEGGVSYTLLATYEYEFDGQQHVGDRIGLNTDAEGEGYEKRKHRELKQLRKNKQPTVCYVNPERPDEAVLDRGLRAMVVLFHLPFVICFTLVGAGVIGGSWYAVVSERRLAGLRAKHRDEPWRVRPDWDTGEIRSSEGKSALGLLCFAVLWNGLSVPAFLIVLASEEEWWVTLLVGLFPAIGLVMVGMLLKRAARMLRHGRSTLRLARTPGVVGGELVGVVLAPAGAKPKDGFRVKLECLRTETRRDSDGDRREVQVPIWEDQRIVDQTLHDSSGKRGVPIRFTIPSDAKPTDGEAKRPIAWRITVHADLPGPDYHAEFEAPVFITEDSQDGVEVTGEPLTRYEREDSPEEALAREGLRVERPHADALRIVSPAMRSPLAAFGTLAISAALIGLSAGLLINLEVFARWIFGPVIGLIGIGAFFAGLDSLLGYCETFIEGDQWRVRSGWRLLRSSEETFTSNEVRQIRVKTSATSSGPSGHTKWTLLFADLDDGREAKLIRSIKSRHAEGLLLKELRHRAGLDGDEERPLW